MDGVFALRFLESDFGRDSEKITKVIEAQVSQAVQSASEHYSDVSITQSSAVKGDDIVHLYTILYRNPK
ncbi:MAG: hypothetical protein EOP04_04705 [Proteobacteria bacterium]|nr:MAG: hypothetical protein EOP04_04705 [Pseudomonadota bacterium]